MYFFCGIPPKFSFSGFHLFLYYCIIIVIFVIFFRWGLIIGHILHRGWISRRCLHLLWEFKMKQHKGRYNLCIFVASRSSCFFPYLESWFLFGTQFIRIMYPNNDTEAPSNWSKSSSKPSFRWRCSTKWEDIARCPANQIVQSVAQSIPLFYFPHQLSTWKKSNSSESLLKTAPIWTFTGSPEHTSNISAAAASRWLRQVSPPTAMYQLVQTWDISFRCGVTRLPVNQMCVQK